MSRSLLTLGLLGISGAAWAQEAPSTGDPVEGALLAEVCAACHALEPEGKHRWGPSLVGVVGRPVGAEDYRYGSYLRARSDAGDRWTEDALRSWLVDSKDLARSAGLRTKMPAQGLTDAEVDDLLSYLRTVK